MLPFSEQFDEENDRLLNDSTDSLTDVLWISALRGRFDEFFAVFLLSDCTLPSLSEVALFSFIISSNLEKNMSSY